MDQDDEIRIAESEFNLATAVLQKCLPGRQGISAEIKYGQAYQRLVKLGLRPQLRKKYRRMEA
jgi:hypothetical protein